MSKKTFLDSNESRVLYRNQPITWRVSTYAVIVQDEKVLLKRGKHEKLWDFPGGAVELNESLTEGCLREVIEEIGAKVKLSELITFMEGWFFLKEKQTYHHTLRFFYHGTLLENIGTPTDSKIQEIQWWSLHDINDDEFQDAVWHVKRCLDK